MRNNKGFTLVELIAVISILSILIIVVATGNLTSFNKTKEKINEEKIKNIKEGVKLFLTDVKYCNDEIDEEWLEEIGENSCSELQEKYRNETTIPFDYIKDNGYVTEDNSSDEVEIIGQIIGDKIVVNVEKKDVDEDGEDEGEKPNYVVEISNNYIEGKTLVVIYTNAANINFKYDNLPLINVSQSQYKYNNVTEYTYKYAGIIDTLSNNELSEYENQIAYIENNTVEVVDYSNPHDLNFDSDIDVRDCSSMEAIKNTMELLFQDNKYQKNILKADFNFDKRVDENDVIPFCS